MAYPSNHDGESDIGRDYGVAAAELKQFVERVEQLEVEEKDIRDQKKEVYAEAKGRGYNIKVLRQAIARRKKDRDALAEEEATLEMYEEALLV
ncbi:DsbA-like protein [Rhodobacter phage RcCWillis]|nr:DsbA-like protein [Rhodobacter phage RcCWillis]